MAHEKLVTAFKQLQSAEVAKKKLLAQGIAEDNIDILSGERLRVKDKEIRHPSFWRRLFGDDIDDDYATEYNRAIKTGGVLLTVRVDKDDADRIEALLDQQSTDYATFDTFDKRAAADIADGNHRHAAATTTAGATPTGTTAAGTVTGATGGAGVVTGGAGVVSGNTPGVVGSSGAATGYDKSVDTAKQKNVKLAEEHVDIGKDKVSDGRVRLRRYTIEDDVAKDVSLYHQHADVVLRAVDEPVYLNDVDWSDKTIAVEESHEVPVVHKTARIREEAGIRSEVTERVETVRDTVRRQEVEVDKDGAHPKFDDKTPPFKK